MRRRVKPAPRLAFQATSGMVALCATIAASMRRELATRFSIRRPLRATVLLMLMLTRMTRPMAVGAAAGTLGHLA